MENHSEIYNKLIKFQDQGVPLAQIEILEYLYENIGNVLTSNKTLIIQKKSQLQTDKRVDKPYIIHNTVQVVYKPKSSNFAQSIIYNPESGYKSPIDIDSPILKLNYEFENKSNHKSQVRTLQKCKDIGLPIGMLFRVEPARYMVLGLLKITSITDLKVTLESYELSYKESALLKEKILSAYRKNSNQRIRRIQDTNYPNLIKKMRETDSDKDYEMRPETVKIPHLINHCEKGQWAIPNFQRYFDWDKNKIKKFLNSVFNGYYVGTLLIWDTSDRSIGVSPIKGVDIKSPSADKIILDGQQRVTSLYYAIKSPKFPLAGDKNQSFFYINFNEFFSPNLGEVIEVFSSELSQEECFNKLCFPFNRILDYTKWIESFEDFLEDTKHLNRKNEIRPLCRNIISKLNFIKEFTISYITLVDMPIRDVVHVFERINTTGQRLDAFDLLIARMSVHEIDLKRLWNPVKVEHPKIFEYFGKCGSNTKGLTVLQSMALCYTESRTCEQADILNIFNAFDGKSDFLDKWHGMLKDVDNAIARLELIADTGFGVRSRKWLPFEPMIPVMAALIHLIETEYKNKRKSCYEKLECWYWISVFSSTYSRAANTRKTYDYNLMTDWLDTDRIPEDFKTFQRDFDHRINLSRTKNTRDSVFRGVLSLLALAGAKDWDTNASVSSQKIFKKHEIDVDHIFPRSKYDKESFSESILNKTWLYGETNKRRKVAKEPSEFINETEKKNFSEDEDGFKRTMASHFINEKALEALKNDDHEAFVRERENTILQEIARRIGSKKTEFQSSIS